MTQKPTAPKSVKVTDHIIIANNRPLTLIAGPCAMESAQHSIDTAGKISEICQKLNVPFIFKTSFDKANRTSAKNLRGVGLSQSLPVFDEIRKTIGCPVLTDIHTEEQCSVVAPHVDVLQIPAFLCRQTDLLLAAARTGKIINVKKGQFLAPWDMANVADKISSAGNEQILLTDRGASFGYNTLVSDMRALPIMAQTGYPVVFDATHSVQQPGGLGTSSGGQREFIPHLARAATAVGIAAIFIETHPTPEKAISDAATQLPLADLPQLLEQLLEFDSLAKKFQ